MKQIITRTMGFDNHKDWNCFSTQHYSINPCDTLPQYFECSDSYSVKNPVSSYKRMAFELGNMTSQASIMVMAPAYIPYRYRIIPGSLCQNNSTGPIQILSAEKTPYTKTSLVFDVHMNGQHANMQQSLIKSLELV